MDVDGDRDRDRGSSRPDRSTRYASTGTTRGPAYANAPYDPMRKAASREIAASEAAKRSRKECRVYVGNLAFGVKWNDLKDFMREGGSLFGRSGRRGSRCSGQRWHGRKLDRRRGHRREASGAAQWLAVASRRDGRAG